MNKKLDEYIQEPYTRILIPNDDGSYSAEILEFSGCFADGNSANEAMENLTRAAESWIETCLEQGLEIPKPFMNQDFGGKVALRLPRSLHRQAVRFAERDGVSLNQFLVTAIAARVGAEDFYSYLANRFERQIASTTPRINIQMMVMIPEGKLTPISEFANTLGPIVPSITLYKNTEHKSLEATQNA